MSTIKDITVKLGKNRFVTTTVILYGSVQDNEYSIPHEDNRGGILDEDEREFVMQQIEGKILKLRIEDEQDEYSDDLEDYEVHAGDNF